MVSHFITANEAKHKVRHHPTSSVAAINSISHMHTIPRIQVDDEDDETPFSEHNAEMHQH